MRRMRGLGALGGRIGECGFFRCLFLHCCIGGLGGSCSCASRVAETVTHGDFSHVFFL